MSFDNQLDDALRALARDGGQDGRIRAATDIRRRGDIRRRRRRTASVALAATAVVALGAGVALARLGGTTQPTPIGPADPSTVTGPSADPSVRSSSPSSSPTASPGTPSSSPAAPSSSPAAPSSSAAVPPSTDRLLSGTRQVAIVRTGAFESAVSMLDDGRLAEVDGVEGRRLFVITPQGPGTYQIRTAADPDADLTDICWEVRSAGSQPLRVEGVPCDQAEPRQRFSLDPAAGGTYLISSNSAYLQNSPTRGLILEEAGDAPVTTHFRLVDNGPAPN
ncbi:RICIN domain-containing protein [Micromonospora sp. DT229]|uniref:RICIN domain-containing protein n=1 Tax=Micromonospora sp. DT229 TaxID=3393430 RepID=UPI003CE6DC55